MYIPGPTLEYDWAVVDVACAEGDAILNTFLIGNLQGAIISGHDKVWKRAASGFLPISTD